MKEEFESPYCKNCSACGEDGCCSYTTCFSKLIEDSKCEYGATYLKDALYNKKIMSLSFSIFDKLEKNEITSTKAVEEFNNGCSDIFDIVYREKII